MQIRKLATFTGHRASIYALSAGKSDRHFLSGGGDGWLVEWNVDEPETGQLLAKIDGQLFSFLYIKEKNLAIAGDMNGGVRFIDIVRPDRQRNIAHHAKGVFDVQLIQNQLFTAGGDGTLTRWDVEKRLAIESIQLSAASLRCLAFSESRREIAVGASDGNIYLLDAATLFLKNTILAAHQPSVFTLAFSPDGQKMVSGGRDALLKRWTVDDGRELADGKQSTFNRQASSVLPAHLMTINHLQFSPDGKLIATASRDRTIKIWDATSLELLKVIDTLRFGGHLRSVNRLRWMSESELVSSSDDRTAAFWKIEI